MMTSFGTLAWQIPSCVSLPFNSYVFPSLFPSYMVPPLFSAPANWDAKSQWPCKIPFLVWAEKNFSLSYYISFWSPLSGNNCLLAYDFFFRFPQSIIFIHVFNEKQPDEHAYEMCTCYCYISNKRCDYRKFVGASPGGQGLFSWKGTIKYILDSKRW